ncbi:monovalent cation/H(+) antiporter subunit G [Desulforhabdus sp. TSK]|uniref:monovalent cation/H(+) antiporter subunit G n=1 Tax=Desulforhabdus sp. TSK TaxID=2925014 RepID=UPI001FC8D8A8|nr:monovalent cation/H(+) antiporter subunit G [Desulforhabdus sp. TSK]GKT08409.1 Na+/H+ antiporter subunit G [Desulforhabdus sp. TSK]
MSEIISTVLMGVGALFMGLAGIGILRMPDLFMRMSCSTKSSTLGVGFLMLAVCFRFPHLSIISRAAAIVVFVFLTAPIAAHMIGRAAYISGVPLWSKSVIDQLCNRYDRCTLHLESYALSEPTSPASEEEASHQDPAVPG